MAHIPISNTIRAAARYQISNVYLADIIRDKISPESVLWSHVLYAAIEDVAECTPTFESPPVGLTRTDIRKREARIALRWFRRRYHRSAPPGSFQWICEEVFHADVDRLRESCEEIARVIRDIKPRLWRRHK